MAYLGFGLLFLLWSGASPKAAFVEGWFFGLGLLGVGVFWMHISIDQFGNVGTALAVVITLLFVALMALYFGAAGWLARRLASAAAGSAAEGLLLLALGWTLFEWLRGWLLGGFPWLALGYSQLDTPLAGWAPLIGVYGVGLAVVVSVAALIGMSRPGRGTRLAWLLVLLLIWGGGRMLTHRQWVEPAGEPISVAIIQGNIEQAQKWLPSILRPTLTHYTQASREQWGTALIIWPETAVPAFSSQVEESFLAPLSEEAAEHGSSLLLGIVERGDNGSYYNAMLSLGESRGAYYKRHLVPFGEFMPFKGLLKPLIDWLQIPMSDFSAGGSGAPLLRLAGHQAGISICYEDAFGEEVIRALPEARFLVNASNDAWFGDSLALPQHLQIARMRALESGRYLLRSTNTGISAIIAPNGSIAARSPAFERHLLRGEITPLQGVTPYARWGNVPVIGMVVLLFCALLLRRYRLRNRRD
ncbi:MAG: apolipoprotein N-acyltransferase [Gammaproteobacteria bacterium]|nr:apolipoprotein N-acyltransferase [Gammaproteobacteria bacterium]